MRTDEEIDAAISRVLGARGANFVALVRLAEMDPATAFRFMDLSGVDFSRQDLRGYDFTGACLRDCIFKNSRIAGARFDQAEVDADALRGAIDWAEATVAEPTNNEGSKPAALVDFDDLLRHFGNLAKRQRPRPETIQGMFRAAPDFRAAAKVYGICVQHDIRLTVDNCAALGSKMTDASIHGWLLPFLEQFLMREERYNGSNQASRLAVQFSNVVAAIEDRGYTPAGAFRELLHLTARPEQALALYEYGAARYGAEGTDPLGSWSWSGLGAELEEYPARRRSLAQSRRIRDVVTEGPLYPRREWQAEDEDDIGESQFYE